MRNSIALQIARFRGAGEFAHPTSRLQIFEKSGHFPHLSEPVRFARALGDFIDTSDPADFEFSEQDLAQFRERLLAGAQGR